MDAWMKKIKRETRRYAKRQLTWFRRDLGGVEDAYKEVMDRLVKHI